MRTSFHHHPEAQHPKSPAIEMPVGRLPHLMACAVTRRRFLVGASPPGNPLQPEAIGAVMEGTKWLKPSISVSRIGDSASVQAATRVNAAQASKRTMWRPTRLPYRGRLIRLDEMSEVMRPDATPGYWRQHVHKESARNTGSPKAWSATTNRRPARDRLGALGWRRGSQYR
jgi:hypothetical protein